MLHPMAYGCGLANALNRTADEDAQGKHLLSEPLEQGSEAPWSHPKAKDSASKE